MKHLFKKTIAAGILPVCKTTGRIMLIRRGMDQGSPNMWAFFGGSFDEDFDNTPKDTAKREFLEESGIKNPLYQISKGPFYINDDNFLRFYSYLGVFNEEFVPNLAEEDEAQDYGWFYLEELPDNLLPGVEETLNAKRDYIKKIIQKNFTDEQQC